MKKLLLDLQDLVITKTVKVYAVRIPLRRRIIHVLILVISLQQIDYSPYSLSKALLTVSRRQN